MKKIAILATGGTISGHSEDRLDFLDYKPGGYSIDEMLEKVPEIKEVANITVEQLENFNSCEMTPFHWSLLKNKVEFYLSDQEFDGVVITHGTNTLEETAYFLHLTVNSEKPVVLVGSQRPFSALGSDAAVNLINSVKVAASSNSKNKGVLVVLNDEINGAREVTKTNTFRLQSFQSGQVGLLGYVDVDGTVQYYRNPIKKHTIHSCFSSEIIEDVPEVAIVYSYAGATGDIIRLVTDSNKYSGIVIAGAGAGMFSTKEEMALHEAVDKGVTVVRSSRVGNGRVVAAKQYQESRFLHADNLLPQKARILLMLSLMMKKDNHDIQNLFKEY